MGACGCASGAGRALVPAGRVWGKILRKRPIWGAGEEIGGTGRGGQDPRAPHAPVPASPRSIVGNSPRGGEAPRGGPQSLGGFGGRDSPPRPLGTPGGRGRAPTPRVGCSGWRRGGRATAPPLPPDWPKVWGRGADWPPRFPRPPPPIPTPHLPNSPPALRSAATAGAAPGPPPPPGARSERCGRCGRSASPGWPRPSAASRRISAAGGAGACRPCNDTELLMAICTSDFVVRGSIRSVSNDAELQESIIGVSAIRIHRQKFPLFQAGGRPGRAAGSIRTPLRCGVRPGPGTFLFTGWLHFGEAWLSCAPRYKDFQRIYEGARRRRQNPCEFPVD
uniref:Meteorin, glial cell differentiation regulator n=1 Tax=Anas platyrhynchos platyrhynchos TaxID=8840 RepID=A0A493TBR9_ANAPP